MLLGEVLAFLHRYNRVVMVTAAVLAASEVGLVILRLL